MSDGFIGSLSVAVGVTGAGRCGDVEDEAGGVHRTVDLEVEEQGVRASGRNLDREADGTGRFVVERVDVEVGEIAVAQGDQVPGGSRGRARS